MKKKKINYVEMFLENIWQGKIKEAYVVLIKQLIMQGAPIDIPFIIESVNALKCTKKEFKRSALMPILKNIDSKQSVNFSADYFLAMVKLANKLNPYEFAPSKGIKDVILQSVWNGDKDAFRTAVFVPYNPNEDYSERNTSFFANFEAKLKFDSKPATLCTAGRIIRYIAEKNLVKSPLCEQTYTNFFRKNLETTRIDLMHSLIAGVRCAIEKK